jgi:protoporphyrin/coproporphyrin ferrochelatase
MGLDGTAILALNFGEPEHPRWSRSLPFLERIFYANASLEPSGHRRGRRRARSRQLAERRAPGLMEEYEEIGGSP